MIVEDEKIIALDLRRRLEKFGFEVCASASRGEEAIRLAGEHRPVLILMDIMLDGDMDGISAALEIKKQYKIPVMFLTAYADEQTLDRAKEAAPLGYILKPFKERELYTTIEMGLYKYQLDQKLREQEELFSTILRSVGDGIFATNEEWKIQFLNPEAEEILGIKMEVAKGHPINTHIKLLDAKSLVPIDLVSRIKEVDKEDFIIDYAVIETPSGKHVHIEGVVNFLYDNDRKKRGLVCSFKDITEIKRLSENLLYQSTHDQLTGLMNRDSFSQKMGEYFEGALTRNIKYCVMFIDIDQFKVVNDSCGHTAGDALLKEVTTHILKKLSPKDIMARLGGDEFGLILVDTDMEGAYEKASELLYDLNKMTFKWEDFKFPIKASFGVMPLNPAAGGVHEILAAVDDACNLAKEEGGNKIRSYKASDESYLKRRGQMQWISHLQKSLEEDRFRLYFQHIKPIEEGSDLVPKAELLIRLLDSEGNLIPPFDFIPAAERYNFMSHIDIWVIQNAFKKMRAYLDKREDPLVFCINLSGGSMSNENLYQIILDGFEKYNVPPERFCFEVTETNAIDNLTAANNFIDKLKHAGCTFALDDFGTGFASFSYLRTLHVDYIKIDGIFIREIEKNPIDYAMVSAINQIAHAMDKKTIAEFVSNQTTLNLLEQTGVDYAQGYLLGKPSPVDNLIDKGFISSLQDQE